MWWAVVDVDGAVAFEEVEVSDDLGDAEHDREPGELGEQGANEVVGSGFTSPSDRLEDLICAVAVVSPRGSGEGGDVGEGWAVSGQDGDRVEAAEPVE